MGLRDRIGTVWRPDQEREIEERAATARRALGAGADGVWEAWRATPLPDVVEYALARGEESGSAVPLGG